nr:Dihydrofolate reductase [uncultured bacterium]
MKISLIAAIGKNRELGRGNELVFKIPEDMKHFKETTMGHAVIMGRVTFESIGRALPNRTNIVVSRDSNYPVPEGVLKASSIEDAIEIAKQHETEEVFVIGGEQIYKLSLPFAERLYLTLVDSEVPDADAFFPEYSDFKTKIYERKSSDENYVYNFLVLSR